MPASGQGLPIQSLGVLVFLLGIQGGTQQTAGAQVVRVLTQKLPQAGLGLGELPVFQSAAACARALSPLSAAQQNEPQPQRQRSPTSPPESAFVA